MKIHYCSDLHIEFGSLLGAMPKGDVLILAGDITLLGIHDPDSNYYKHDCLTDRTKSLLDECERNFARVFYLIGNHEFYGSNISLADSILRRRYPQVTFLENKVVDLGDDVLLVAGTLWTDMNDGAAASVVGRRLNDFRVVHINDKKLKGIDVHCRDAFTRPFQPSDAMERFAKTKRFISRTAKKNPEKTIVVATHHAPSIQGIDPIHVHTSLLNHGYYTDLEAFIADHPNIRYWVHGHTHLQKTYTIGQCTVLSNARGYIGQEDCATAFDPNCWFDPVTSKRRDPGNAKRKAKEPA